MSGISDAEKAIAKVYARWAGTEDGQRILDDLEKEGGLHDATTPADLIGKVDGRTLDKLADQAEGRRMLVGYVKNRILLGAGVYQHEKSETERVTNK